MDKNTSHSVRYIMEFCLDWAVATSIHNYSMWDLSREACCNGSVSQGVADEHGSSSSTSSSSSSMSPVLPPVSFAGTAGSHPTLQQSRKHRCAPCRQREQQQLPAVNQAVNHASMCKDLDMAARFWQQDYCY
jgi:hypothetical protein